MLEPGHQATHRVLLVTSNSSGRGGGERLLVYLAEGLARIGCDTHVLLGDQLYMDAWIGEYAKTGATLHRMPLVALRDRPLRFVQSVLDVRQHRRIAAFCRHLAPSAILVNQQYDEDALDYIAGAVQAHIAPVGALLHMPMTRDKHRRPLGSWRGRVLKRWYGRQPHRTILTSTGSQHEFASYYRTPLRPALLRTGIPFDGSRHTDDAVSLPDGWSASGPPVVGFVGQFVAQKHLSLLVESWLATRQRGIDSRLLLVGDGPERDLLQDQLRSAPVPADRWHITGWTDHAQAYLAVMDVFAMSSRFEGLPLALVEAAGSSLPAVVTDFNGAADVAAAASWVAIVKEHSVPVFSQALGDALRDLHARKLQAQTHAATFRERHSLQAMAHNFLSVLSLE